MRLRGFALAIGLNLGILGVGTAYAGPVGGPDTDGDGFPDVFDNCTGVANATQADTNHNGCGDACRQSCDGNDDDQVGAPDLLLLGMQFGMAGCTPATCSMDCDGDTTVGAPDYLAMGMQFGMTAGPSGIAAGSMGMAPAPLCNPVSCDCP